MTALGLALGLLVADASDAAPRRPASDTEIVERLPSRAGDPTMRELDALRAAWRRDPRDPDAAVALARRYVVQAGASGDPRYVGYAQAALEPWWHDADPPPAVRVQRAVLMQFEHRFAEALSDLDAAVAVRPGDGEAWAWIAAIQMVRADYAAARRACDALAPLATALIGTACTAYVDAMTGRAAAAAGALQQALDGAVEADPAQRLWVLTRLAETQERRGEFETAERAFRRALALGIDDVYLLAAYADFLLDRGRAAEVLTLLKGRTSADVLLLRAALAAKAEGRPEAARWAAELSARFAAAGARGDRTHRKEESRFVLGVQGDAARALVLARENYAQQRELADARLLLEAAIAARAPDAATPVLEWMNASGVESGALHRLAGQLQGLR